jgi:hypothetical protein
LNVHKVNDVSQREIHTAQPLVPEPSVFEVDMAIKTQRHKLPDIEKNLIELNKAVG